MSHPPPADGALASSTVFMATQTPRALMESAMPQSGQPQSKNPTEEVTPDNALSTDGKASRLQKRLEFHQQAPPTPLKSTPAASKSFSQQGLDLDATPFKKFPSSSSLALTPTDIPLSSSSDEDECPSPKEAASPTARQLPQPTPQPSASTPSKTPKSATKAAKSPRRTSATAQPDAESDAELPAHLTERQLMRLLQERDRREQMLSNVYKRNQQGETPLHVAAIEGDLNLVRDLIKAEAPINATDNAGYVLVVLRLSLVVGDDVSDRTTLAASLRWTPLHEACNHGHLEISELMLENGAKVDAKGMGDDTPLHDAAMNGHDDVITLLFKFNANPNPYNKQGKTPLDVACDEETEDLLRSFGCIHGSLPTKRRKPKKPKRAEPTTAETHQPAATQASKAEPATSSTPTPNSDATPAPSAPRPSMPASKTAQVQQPQDRSVASVPGPAEATSPAAASTASSSKAAERMRKEKSRSKKHREGTAPTGAFPSAPSTSQPGKASSLGKKPSQKAPRSLKSATKPANDSTGLATSSSQTMVPPSAAHKSKATVQAAATPAPIPVIVSFKSLKKQAILAQRRRAAAQANSTSSLDRAQTKQSPPSVTSPVAVPKAVSAPDEATRSLAQPTPKQQLMPKPAASSPAAAKQLPTQKQQLKQLQKQLQQLRSKPSSTTPTVSIANRAEPAEPMLPRPAELKHGQERQSEIGVLALQTQTQAQAKPARESGENEAPVPKRPHRLSITESSQPMATSEPSTPTTTTTPEPLPGSATSAVGPASTHNSPATSPPAVPTPVVTPPKAPKASKPSRPKAKSSLVPSSESSPLSPPDVFFQKDSRCPTVRIGPKDQGATQRHFCELWQQKEAAHLCYDAAREALHAEQRTERLQMVRAQARVVEHLLATFYRDHQRLQTTFDALRAGLISERDAACSPYIQYKRSTAREPHSIDTSSSLYALQLAYQRLSPLADLLKQFHLWHLATSTTAAATTSPAPRRSNLMSDSAGPPDLERASSIVVPRHYLPQSVSDPPLDDSYHLWEEDELLLESGGERPLLVQPRRTSLPAGFDTELAEGSAGHGHRVGLHEVLTCTDSPYRVDRNALPHSLTLQRGPSALTSILAPLTLPLYCLGLATPIREWEIKYDAEYGQLVLLRHNRNLLCTTSEDFGSIDNILFDTNTNELVAVFADGSQVAIASSSLPICTAHHAASRAAFADDVQMLIAQNSM
ncbi:uncharacterized protein MONBRDRAFT_38485 [Monosiga brevicollis MX1]|uniref:Uncharacterized protein n=1 Tax=Monosiga brevicollis TaxID=81824 RepID=A9V849_MONBE|nr:uncharacterized protein MONBRDRAFT_38485 [Monosiga brevicollis MX1]EDQ86276.1 predicted protein [Monosiga brevicollis MX1]|eukprot:XP_001748946.1 hypothetical protein [Monosiga brevicollis MX1]